MLQYTYISTVAPGIADSELDDILTSSRRNNARDGVSGLLVYDGKRFLQALEGDGAYVEATIARIKSDPRHRAIVILSAREVAERQFGEWAMACECAQPARLGGVTMPQIVDALVANVPDPNMQALFSGFARLQRTTAA